MQEIKNEVRNITDYNSSILPDEKLSELVGSAQSDILTLTGLSEDEVNWTDDTTNANRALVWTTCLFALAKARELDSSNMSVESLDMESVRAAGQQYGNDPVIWLRKARRFRQRLDDEKSSDSESNYVARVESARESRQYSRDSGSGGSGGGVSFGG